MDSVQGLGDNPHDGPGRVLRKPTMTTSEQLIPMSDRLAASLRTMLQYLGLSSRRLEPVKDPAGLKRFLETRASFMAQTSLYGYLRTRAGMRYPELFDDDPFVVSINIAKWHVWLACLSDLAVYAGGLLAQHPPGHVIEAGRIIQQLVREILDDTGIPEEADAEFAAHAERVRARVAHCDWTGVTDDESAFSESPTALVRWAPVVDELKQLDEGIVKNSVRFRWQEIRRDLRRSLDAHAVLSAAD
jgi:hypothetical protein